MILRRLTLAIPIVTCDAKIVVVWNYGSGTLNAPLSATATESPTGWTWTILFVPPGLEALLSGTWGDFIDGVATTEAGDASAVTLDGIPTATVAGTIVIQAVAANGEGPSVPTVDRANGQQPVAITTENYGYEIPGDYQYAWGDRGPLSAALRIIDGITGGGLTPVGPLTDLTYNVSVGELVTIQGTVE
jgi:hypothetical protein